MILQEIELIIEEDVFREFFLKKKEKIIEEN